MLPPSIVTAGQLVCGVRCAGALQCIHINWMNYVLQLTFIKSNFSHSFIIKFYYQITMINWTLSTRSSHNPDSTKKKKSKNRIKQSLSKYDRKFWILFNAIYIEKKLKYYLFCIVVLLTGQETMEWHLLDTEDGAGNNW